MQRKVLAPVVLLLLGVAALVAARSGTDWLGTSQFDSAPARELRVCADPNNLPFSNHRLEGFENKIAELIAEDLNLRLTYTWWPQRRGFIRNTVRAGLCDLVIGVPSSYELVRPTSPYYRSTYVFVFRSESGLDLSSFDDPVLHDLRIGVHLVGDDGANPPPTHALGRRGIIRNVRGYSIYGNYAEDNPPARLIEAVGRGDLDVAIAWGPLAGFFATRQATDLTLVPVSPQIDLPFSPMVFDISMGVERTNLQLHADLEAFVMRKMPEITAILDAYGVPRVESARQRFARPSPDASILP